MPLMTGWGTDDRRLLLHLVHAINRLESTDRRDRIALHPELLRARADMLAYIKRGTTGTTGGTALRLGPERPPRSANAPLVTLDTNTASNVLGVSDSRVRRLCRGGKLAAIKSDGEWQIDRDAVEERRRQRASRNGSRPNREGSEAEPLRRL